MATNSAPSTAPWRSWGAPDEQSTKQMEAACALPISVRGALMPDAHVGYGLPIGGVLATDNAVIPFAVGVDIACRMKITVLDAPLSWLTDRRADLVRVLERETRFGVGASFEKKRDHPVMHEDWRITPVTRGLRDKAWSQLGTSGSGNHFVEYGLLEVVEEGLPLSRGTHLALLSHSGSRGSGATVCDYYRKIAQQKRPAHAHLAWLGLDEAEGLEYWAAMELMGRYASANHACIHRSVLSALAVEPRWTLENHHNFAWREVHDGREVIVHRKGATPAGEGTLGVIPGSMASPGFIVRGKGSVASLSSASHGAGRMMSRQQALKTFDWKSAKQLLSERGVQLLSAGLDEVPMVYKDIHQVMAAQNDLVEVLARFDPKIVKMAPAGEKAED